jgi:hypothetical protein
MPPEVCDKVRNMGCIPLLITHFARPRVLETARERGIIVVQSFEW